MCATAGDLDAAEARLLRLMRRPGHLGQRAAGKTQWTPWLSWALCYPLSDALTLGNVVRIGLTRLKSTVYLSRDRYDS